MFCHQCGKKLVTGARFCSWCSTPVPEEILEEMSRDDAVQPAPGPERTAVPVPAPVPEPAAVPAAALIPQPVAEPVPARPAPKPVAVPAPEPEPEPVTMCLKVTKEQVEREETVLLGHEAMAEPMELTLRKDMYTGMRLRLKNAPMKPSPTGAKQVLVVVLQVESPRKPAPAPVRQAPVAAPGPAERKRPSFTPVTLKYGFQLCPEEKLKTGFKLNGADEIGSVTVSPVQIEVFRKSKAVSLAGGAIGSMIEGAGKRLATISPSEIASSEKLENKRGPYEYRIHLKDGRVLKVNVTTTRTGLEQIRALDLFLSQVT